MHAAVASSDQPHRACHSLFSIARRVVAVWNRSRCRLYSGNNSGAHLQRAGHRTLAGNLNQLRAQRRIEFALDRDDPLEAVDFALTAFSHSAAVRAVLSRGLAMTDCDGYAAEREVPVLRVRAQRHRRAGTERDREVIIGPGARIAPAHRNYLLADPSATP